MKKFVLFVLAFAVVATVGASSANASGYSTACTLPVKSGDIVVNFKERLFSDRNPHVLFRSTSIPAGKYKIALQAIDGYVGRTNADPARQGEEQYYVQFRAGGSAIATSGVSGDVPDGVEFGKWQGVVNTSLTIPQNVTGVMAKHNAYKNNVPNSVTPICMVATPIQPPKVTGKCNPSLDEKYLSSKPTSNLCTSGTPTHVRGSGTVNDPWMWDCVGSNGGGNDWCKAFKKNHPVCGNGTVEAGEQCDDGNTNNGDGCSNQCTTENVNTQCPYTASGDQIIVDGYSKRLVSPTSTDRFEEVKAQNIPAGDYKVELAAYDFYNGRPQTKVQPNERWKLVLRDGAGDIATSGSTQDLQDGVVFASWKGTVNNKLTVSRDATLAVARHSVYVDNSNANSVQPICARLTPKPKPPVCGNGKVEAGEQCDDGNTHNYDGCSNQCVPEEPAIKIIKDDNDDKDDMQTVTKGETATFSIVVKNTGKVHLKNVKVNDPLAPNCDKTIGNLNVGQTESYTCTAANVQNAFTNIAKVTGKSVNGKNVSDSDPSKVKVKEPKKPSISIDKNDNDNKDDMQTVTKGEAATFTITVKNDGEVDLENVVVSDPLAPNCDKNIGDLDVNETESYTCTVANVQDGFTNVAEVEGESKVDGSQVDDKDDSKVKVEDPSAPKITIVIDDNDNKDDTQEVESGNTATFEVVVTNTGNTDLENVVVTVPDAPNCDKNIGDLAEGDSFTYTCTKENVTAGETIEADVIGTQVGTTTTVTDDDPTNITVPEPGEASIEIEKRDAIDKDDDQLVEIGGTAQFEIIVRNNGQVDLKDVKVSDPLAPACDKNIGNLAVGETESYTCNAANVQGAFTNVANVEGTPVDGGSKVTDSDPSRVDTESTPQGPICGNGIVEEGEECDGGDDCNSQCEKEEDRDCDAKIGDRVWLDKNGNGIQDPGEPGISGVKMKVIDGNDKDYDTTDADGKYKFKDLCGKVRVIVATETLPQGCWQTYDRDGKLDHSYKRKLDDDESYKKADFGYRCPTTTTTKRSPETGAAGAATGLATLLAAAGAGLNYRRSVRKQK